MSVSTPNDPSGRGQQPNLNDALAGNGPRQNTNEASPSITRANSILGRTFKLRTSGEQVRQYVDGIHKQIPEDMRKTYAVYPLDNPSALAISAVLMTKRVVQDSKEHVFFFTILLGATSRIPTERTENINNLQVVINQTPSEALDAQGRMWDAIRERVRELFPSRSTTFHQCGFMVAHATLNPENLDDIHGLLYSAGRALDGFEAQIFNTQPPITVAWMRDAQVNSRISYNPAPVIDTSGMPLRTDLTVETIVRSKQGQQQSVHNDEIPLTRIGGFIDLIYQQPQAPQFHGQIVDSRRYRARLVITSNRSLLDAETIESLLIGLVSGPTLLSRYMNWAGVFVPRHGVDPKLDTRDIGAIGYEVPLDPTKPNEPLGAKIKTRDPKFTRENLGELLQKAFYPDLVISQDVIENGPDFWLERVLIEAAKNNPEAVSAILQGANNLTEGKFQKHWKGGPILVDTETRIHMAWYKAPNGELRDSRDMDYLSLLNLSGDKGVGPGTPVVDYSSSLDNHNLHPLLRLDTRRQLLQARFRENLNIVGWARRITWTPDFLVALANACAEAGLVIRPENAQLDFTDHSGRGGYDASAYALSASAQVGLFNYGGTGYGGGYSFSSGYGPAFSGGSTF